MKKIAFVLTCLYSLVSNADPFFKVTFIKNSLGTGGYVTVRTITPHHTYPNAGIRIIDKNYRLSEDSCNATPVGKLCPFQVSDTQPVTFKITKLLTLDKIKSALPETIGVSLALNADELSKQTYLTAAQEPGRIIGYLYGWETPPPAADIAAAGYTHVLIAFGIFSTAAPGTINIASISGFDLTTYVQSLHQSGLKVLLSIGGASTNIPGTTVDFDTAVSLASSPSAFETTFLSSMTTLMNTYQFDGFDFDVESGLNGASSFTNPSSGCSNSTYSSLCDIFYLSTIINTFHAQSPSSMLTLAPQIANIAATSGFSSVWGNYASLVMQTYSALTWVGFQNYNSGCAYGINLVCYPTGSNTLTSTPDAAVSFATDLLTNWPATTSSGQATGFQPYISYLTPSQVVVGYVVNNGAGMSDGSPAAITAVTQHVIQCLRSGENCDTYTPPTTYPGIGGVFSWTINYDASNNYQFAKSLYPCVVQGNCV